MLVDRSDLGGEDGEEHGLGENEGQGEAEPAELGEEAEEGYILAGSALGLLDGVDRLGHLGSEAVLNDVVVATDEGDEGDQGDDGDGDSGEEVEESGGRAGSRGGAGITRAVHVPGAPVVGGEYDDTEELGKRGQDAGDALASH